jgi:hypothetical protein
MRNVRVWIDDPSIQTFPKLQGNVIVDVLVARTGVTGSTVACPFKKGGSTVALIERERVPVASSLNIACHSPNERPRLISK